MALPINFTRNWLTHWWDDNFILIREIRPYRLPLLVTFVCMLTASSMEGLGIGLVLSFLQSLVNPDTLPFETGIDVVDTSLLGAGQPPLLRLQRLSLVLVIATIIRVSFAYSANIISGIIQSRILERLRNRIVEEVQSLSLTYFSEANTGEILNNLTVEINQLRSLFQSVTLLSIRFLSLSVYLIAAFVLSWQLTLIAVLGFSLLMVGNSYLRRRVRAASSHLSQANGQFTGHIAEFLSGIQTVHIFDAFEFERRRCQEFSEKISEAFESIIVRSALVEPLSEGVTVTVMVTIIILGYGAYNLTIPSLLTFMFSLLRIAPSVRVVNTTLMAISRMSGSLNAVKSFLSSIGKPYFENGAIAFGGLEREITLRSVCFSYGHSYNVIENLDLTINKGEVTAFVGGSGAGKTTLAMLIPRLYTPQRGAVLFDGIDAREIEVGSLRQKVAVVSQDTFIFNTTIRENIAYALHESIESRDIERAAKLANIHDYIVSLPEGYSTVVGDRGIKLSGGQKQRIAIARALLRHPDILILDEATSALDSETEKLIQDAIKTVSKGKTVIAIAHRLSTIVNADKVVVLERGQILEEGRYHELLRRDGKLKYFHDLQFV